jgi:hypothetical protein
VNLFSSVAFIMYYSLFMMKAYSYFCVREYKHLLYMFIGIVLLNTISFIIVDRWLFKLHQ